MPQLKPNLTYEPCSIYKLPMDDLFVSLIELHFRFRTLQQHHRILAPLSVIRKFYTPQEKYDVSVNCNCIRLFGTVNKSNKPLFHI